MKKLFIIILMTIALLTISIACLAVDNPNANQFEIQADQSLQTDMLNVASVISPLADTHELLTNGVANILAALLLGVLGWLVALINKYLNIKIMTSQVTGIIVRQAEQLEKQNLSNNDKRDIVVQHIKQNQKKKVSKWANILYGGLEEAVSTVYKSVVKNAVKSITKG